MLGAPPPIPDARVGFGLGAIILVAAILPAALGASLARLMLVEFVLPGGGRRRGDGWACRRMSWNHPLLSALPFGRSRDGFLRVMIVEDEPIGAAMEMLVQNSGMTHGPYMN